jgi:hypothetical protein
MIISPTRLKKTALELASKRHHKFSRVSREFIEKADRHLVVWMMQYISQLPSKGKTIK